MSVTVAGMERFVVLAVHNLATRSPAGAPDTSGRSSNTKTPARRALGLAWASSWCAGRGAQQDG